MNNSYPIPDVELKRLAPQTVVSHRKLRYVGDGKSVTLADFAEDDQQRIQRLYNVLQDLLQLLRQHWDSPDAGTRAVKQFIQDVNWISFMSMARQIGPATYEQQNSTELGNVVHDIKGGGFAALSIYLQLLEMEAEDIGELSRLFFLTRDHLKIMRNAVSDLDPPMQEKERSYQPHTVHLLVEKWAHTVHQLEDAAAEIMLDCRFEGTISERCLEFAALDRVLYNMINNAVRHTADNRVYFLIFGVPEADPHDLRFIIYNRMGEEHQQTLHERYQGKCGELFRGGFTTGGHGLGMRICADFVNNAYGIRDFDAGLAGGYFGARCIDDYFVNWFHWPIAAD